MMFHATDLAVIVVLALGTAAIAMSFTQGSMFEPLRQWIAKQSTLLGELARCFFCLSHWIAIAAVAIYQPRPVRVWWPADFVISIFVTVALATMMCGLMFAAVLGAIQSHVLRERMMQAMSKHPGEVAPPASGNASLSR